jgi:eukaryotic-like serine/threonine-protein kinase
MTANRTLGWSLLIVAVIAAGSLYAPVVWAQPDGPPPGSFGPGSNLAELALQKSVREQLKLTSEEVDHLKPLVDEITHTRGTAWRAARDLEPDERRKKLIELTPKTDKMVSDVVEPAKFKRLKQISWQVQGPMAFRDPEVISGLQMTADQQKECDRLRREGREEMGKLFQGILSINANLLDKARDISDATRDKIVALLTPEQKTKWTEMLGDTFSGELEFGGISVRR